MEQLLSVWVPEPLCGEFHTIQVLLWIRFGILLYKALNFWTIYTAAANTTIITQCPLWCLSYFLKDSLDSLLLMCNDKKQSSRSPSLLSKERSCSVCVRQAAAPSHELKQQEHSHPSHNLQLHPYNSAAHPSAGWGNTQASDSVNCGTSSKGFSFFSIFLDPVVLGVATCPSLEFWGK